MNKLMCSVCKEEFPYDDIESNDDYMCDRCAEEEHICYYCGTRTATHLIGCPVAPVFYKKG